MREKTFGEFVDKKKRESVRHLRLVKAILEKGGMKVDNFLNESEEGHDPYVFCHNPRKSGGFDGIRIYKIGGQCCFRVQKENKTHPFGSAYSLPIETMFHDYLSDGDVDEMEAGRKIVEAVNKEVRKFFDRSAEAERASRERDVDNSGDVLVRTTGTDYSSMVYSKG
jgi:hypothetical protein